MSSRFEYVYYIPVCVLNSNMYITFEYAQFVLYGNMDNKFKYVD